MLVKPGMVATAEASLASLSSFKKADRGAITSVEVGAAGV